MLDPELKKKLDDADRRQKEEVKELSMQEHVMFADIQRIQEKYIGILRGIILESKILQ